MYFIYLFAALGTLACSLAAFRHVLHPHFLNTMAIVAMFMSDFLIRGYESEQLAIVPGEDLWVYQLLILGFCLITFCATYLISRLDRRIASPSGAAFTLNTRARTTLALFAWTLVAFDLVKRLHFSNWSVEAAVQNSLGPYGSAPWYSSTGFLGDEKIIYQLGRTFLPFAGISFALLWPKARLLAKLLYMAGFILVVAFLFAEGSRTPVVVTIGGCMMLYLIRRPGALKTSIAMTLGAVSIAILTSAMYLYRAEGFIQQANGAERDPLAITYHQDDNYYRAIHALHIAATTEQRWDSLTFLTTIVVNPIPRVLWPEKPALLGDFYGAYKEEWVTISLIGELAALFGPLSAFLISLLIGVGLFLLQCRASRLVNKPAGLIVYVLVGLYCYMVLRSLLNISQFVYLPAFGYLVYCAVNWRTLLAKIVRPYEKYNATSVG